MIFDNILSGAGKIVFREDLIETERGNFTKLVGVIQMGYVKPVLPTDLHIGLLISPQIQLNIRSLYTSNQPNYNAGMDMNWLTKYCFDHNDYPTLLQGTDERKTK